MIKLENYRERIPWFQQILDEIYLKLDPSEFYFPDDGVEKTRRQLERLLGMFVMTYNASISSLDIPVYAHLCANVKGADLSPEQVSVLQTHEGEVKSRGVSFVVYQRPLEIINPNNSPIASLYK